MDIRVDQKEVKKAKSKFSGRQVTFQSPLSDLERFIAKVDQSEAIADQGFAYIDQYVFEPKNTNSFLQKASEGSTLVSNTVIGTVSSSETKGLLIALLSDWIDFGFLFNGSRFGIYADHDEYCTFFSNYPMVISNLKANLENDGFKLVSEYTRSLT